MLFIVSQLQLNIVKYGYWVLGIGYVHDNLLHILDKLKLEFYDGNWHYTNQKSIIHAIITIFNNCLNFSCILSQGNSKTDPKT